jgi:hypothetical protein
MNNDIRNILLDLCYLKKALKDVEMTKQTKDKYEYYYNSILENINYLLENENKENQHKIEQIKNNKELLEHITKGEM